MSVKEQRTVEIAGADVTDDYTVELHTPDSRKRRTVLTPEQAYALADELYDAARRAERCADEDTGRWAHSAVQHGFDLAPSCSDCVEGKHGACIGSTYVERGPEIDEVACRCAEAGHPARVGEARR